MRENRELMEINKHLTDAEIMLAIRYLDPDLCTKKTRVGSVGSICIPLLTALAVALTYIGFYVWRL
jgi:hypothetical protein